MSEACVSLKYRGRGFVCALIGVHQPASALIYGSSVTLAFVPKKCAPVKVIKMFLLFRFYFILFKWWVWCLRVLTSDTANSVGCAEVFTTKPPKPPREEIGASFLLLNSS